jgi:hypothetical protein
MPPIAPPKTPVLTPLHLPLSTRLDEISLPLGVPSNPFLAHFALLVPPEALCSPATSLKFSKRCPYGAARLAAPATGRGARHFLGGRRSAAPADQPAPPGRGAIFFWAEKSRLAKLFGFHIYAG